MPAHRTGISLYVAAKKFNSINYRLTNFNYGDKKKNEQMLLEQKKKTDPQFTAIFNLFFSLHIFFQTNICRSMNESTLQNADSNIQKAHTQEKRGEREILFFYSIQWNQGQSNTKETGMKGKHSNGDA
jgi:hypothetical protein